MSAMMTLRIAAAECRYMLISMQSLLTFAALFGVNFLYTANAVEFQAYVNGVVLWANSPTEIMDMLIRFSVFGIPIIPAYIANALLKDTDHHFDGIMFSTPISKGNYLNGRFLGAFVAMVVAMSGAPIGLLMGTFWPWASPELLGPTELAHYAIPYLAVVVPSLLAVSAILFAIVAMTRSLIFSYIAAMGLMAMYAVVSLLESTSPMLDPFMYQLFEQKTQYWTAVELNTRVIAFDSKVWLNRLTWLALALISYLTAFFLFSFRVAAKKGDAKNKVSHQPRSVETGPRHDGTPRWTKHTAWYQLGTRLAFEIKSIAKSAPFEILMVLSAVVLFLSLGNREVMYGVNALPLTYLLVDSLTFLTLPMLIVSAFYSAEIFWRERQAGFSEVIDATPTPDWVFVLAKVGALVFILLSITLLGLVMALGFQIAAHHYDFQLGLYLHQGLIIHLLPVAFIAVLACLFQVITNHRYGGMLLFGLFMLAVITSRDLLSWEHPLLSYGLPVIGVALSEMNGIDRFADLAYWIRAYWGAIAGLFLVLTYVLWSRGTTQPMKLRLRQLQALTEPAAKWPILALCVVGLASGGFVFYNTNILNDYVTQPEVEALQVAYEQRYGQYQALPMPRTVAIDMQVDLFPSQRRVEVRGSHVLENQSGQVIDTVHVVFDPGTDVLDIKLDGSGSISREDDPFNYYIIDLASAMQPAERRTLTFQQQTVTAGFPHDRPDSTLVSNGTFISNEQLAPHIGFQPNYLLDVPAARQAHGLPPLPRRPPLEDQNQQHNNVLRQDSDFIDYKLTLSTEQGQLGVAPGYLVRQWNDGDRRYFAYEMDVPIRNFYSVLSADYASYTDRWNDVELEILHHAAHDQNLDRMMLAIKDSLGYFSQAFSPYQYRQLRIVEFPGYRAYAQSFPNTIPYSEDIGFVADVKDGDLDMPYYVTAHEVAHQWWGHQISAANVQGDGLIHETLAQYSALLVMERRYGRDGVRPFLKYELDRYLKQRSNEVIAELPLYREEDQPYIHYRKGTVIMYALRDYLGADLVNRVLKRLIELRAYSSQPYATSLDFLRLLKEEAGPKHLAMIEDFFERVTLYDLKLLKADVSPRADGRFDVTLQIDTGKYYAGNGGIETPAPFDLAVDIGLFAKDPAETDFTANDVIELDKHHVEDGVSTLKMTVDQAPVFAGIDPYNKLIDRDSEDNLGRVRGDY